MSAFLVDPSTLNVILSAVRGDFQGAWCPGSWRDQTPTALGELLLAMSARAVGERYARTAEGYEPGAFVAELGYPPRPLRALKAMDCLIYQCTEGEVPEEPLYAELVDVRNSLARFILGDLPDDLAVRRAEKLVPVFIVLATGRADLADLGPGPMGDGVHTFRFRREIDADTWASIHTYYGGAAKVSRDDVPRRIAERWGCA